MSDIKNNQEDERIQLEIEKGVFDQVSELIAPMHISHEKLIAAFLKWCTDPDTQEEAMAWLQAAMKTEKEKKY